MSGGQNPQVPTIQIGTIISPNGNINNGVNHVTVYHGNPNPAAFPERGGSVSNASEQVPQTSGPKQIAPSSANGQYVADYINKSNIHTKEFLKGIYNKVVNDTTDVPGFAMQLLDEGVIKQEQLKMTSAELYQLICQKNAILACVRALEESGNDHIVEAMVTHINLRLR